MRRAPLTNATPLDSRNAANIAANAPRAPLKAAATAAAGGGAANVKRDARRALGDITNSAPAAAPVVRRRAPRVGRTIPRDGNQVEMPEVTSTPFPIPTRCISPVLAVAPLDELSDQMDTAFSFAFTLPDPVSMDRPKSAVDQVEELAPLPLFCADELIGVDEEDLVLG